jgi:tetratricopeptide (TPR) repeat protein
MTLSTRVLRMFAAVAAAIFAAAAFGGQTPSFEMANDAFRDSRFQEATEKYEALVGAGHMSSTLFYNLGNAWFRLGNVGKAILNYERAIALDPHHPEAKANLALARDEARALELQRNGTERWLGNVTTSQCTVVASIGAWLALFVAVHVYFSQRRQMFRNILLIMFLCGVSAGAAFVAYTIETGSHGLGLAIVTAKNVEARVATADNAKGVLSLPPGSQIKILKERGDWTYAALPNGLQGWIPANSAERVRI